MFRDEHTGGVNDSSLGSRPRTESAIAATALDISSGITNTKVAVVAISETVTELSVHTRPTPEDAPVLIRTVLSLIGMALTDTGAQPEVIGIASIAETGVPWTPTGTC